MVPVADTAFEKNITKYDVILTMYHDQGLPVIKFDNFKTTVNVTGLPIVRVSVDHGTALDWLEQVKLIHQVLKLLKLQKTLQCVDIKKLVSIIHDKNLINKIVRYIAPMSSDEIAEIGLDGAPSYIISKNVKNLY